MTTTDHLQDLRDIRSMMERSTRFISLSGLSGILAGFFALLGALVAYWYLDLNFYRYSEAHMIYKKDFYLFFFLDAGIVLFLALASGVFFTVRNARKRGNKVWDNTSKRFLINLMVPLIAGGIFCLALLYHGAIWLIAPATLIFYGLALLNGSKFSLDDIRYLGYSEIALGLISTIWTGYGLLFWSLGFGVLHIVYGILMYRKYEK